MTEKEKVGKLISCINGHMGKAYARIERSEDSISSILSRDPDDVSFELAYHRTKLEQDQNCLDVLREEHRKARLEYKSLKQGA